MTNSSSSRTIHLVDIENLIGNPRPTLAEVAECYQEYRSLIGKNDLVVVACNHGAFAAVAWGWPNARRLVRSGPSGADKALLEVLTGERVAERFASVVVASGDSIFTDSVSQLGGKGIAVAVVSRADALSRRLRMAARHVFELAPIAEVALVGSGEPA